MKLVSVNVGLPREITWHGTHVRTSIYKRPVEGRIALRTLNLEGDRQADLSVHGGANKAVYCYPIEHYTYWKEELPGQELPFGVFLAPAGLIALLFGDAIIGWYLRISGL